MVGVRRLIFLACAVVFLEVTFFAVLTPLLPSYKSDLHLSEAAVGVLVGALAVGALVASVPAGWLVARIGARTTVILGLVGMGIFSPLFGFSDDVVLLDIFRFLQGASGAMLWAGAIAWVAVAAPTSRRGEMIGIVMAGAVVGELCGAPLGALAHAIGTEIVFSLVLLAAVVLIGLALTIPDSADVEAQPLAEAWHRIRHSDVPTGALLIAAPAFAFGAVVVVAPLHMDDLGASPFLIAAAFAAGAVVESIVGPMIGRLSDRVGRTLPYRIGVVTIIVAIVALGAFGLLEALFASVVLLAFGAGMAATPASTLITDLATAAGINQGFASGASNVAWGGGQALGSLIAGILAGVSGYLLPCLVVAAFLAVAGTVARSLGVGPPVIAGLNEEAGTADGG